MNIHELLYNLNNDEGNHYLRELYGTDEVVIKTEKDRALHLIKSHLYHFSDQDVTLLSSPGRTEIIGNHTDHQQGMVVAASVTLDCIGVASKNPDQVVRIHDIKYQKDYLINLNEPLTMQDNAPSSSLIRGILDGFLHFGFAIGGFNCSVASNVISGIGISSSASFEMLLCKILDLFYNNSTLTKTSYAIIGQHAENHFWHKQSGLMDQIACATGGVVQIDFQAFNQPEVKKIPFELSDYHYELLLIDTDTNHVNLNHEYSSIPNEMTLVANHMKKKVLRDIPFESFLKNLKDLRTRVGDRAILRAFHFYEENRRVFDLANALKEQNFHKFLKLISASGNSSWKYLQNCYSHNDSTKQSMAYYLALTESFLKTIGTGACRVHGGGFAGAIVVYLPKNIIPQYVQMIHQLTGNELIYPMNIRKFGIVSWHEIVHS